MHEGGASPNKKNDGILKAGHHPCEQTQMNPMLVVPEVPLLSECTPFQTIPSEGPEYLLSSAL